jgi:hypothetical protein
MAYSSARHSPGCNPSSDQSPILHRTSRKVGWPTAAVILRTCLFLPSLIELEPAIGHTLADPDRRIALPQLRIVDTFDFRRSGQSIL